MREHSISVEKIAYSLLIVILLIYSLVMARAVLSPLFFAMFFGFMLKPVCDFYETFIRSRILSILLTFLTAILPIFGAVIMFSYQLIDVLEDFSLMTERAVEAVNSVMEWLGEHLPIRGNRGENWMLENVSQAIDQPLGFIANGVSSSTLLLANLFLVAIYTFFFLFYRTAIRNFFLIQFDRYNRTVAYNFLTDVQHVSQQYLFGIGVVMLILGLMNSAGLMIIGIDYAFFWGFLAAFLAIIPYIGTFIGGFLPFLYALSVTNTTWQPIAVIAMFSFIQTIEGNLITPKIVGSSLKINPLAAILSLIIGGAIWGIPGLILALPITAILKVVFDHIDSLKTVGLLLSSELYDEKDAFYENFDNNKYRLFSLFQKPFGKRR